MKASSKYIAKSILTVVIAGLICNSIWLFEVFNVKGWGGLNWLDGYMNSVFVIIPVTVISYMLCIRFFEKIDLRNLLLTFFVLSIISLISYEIARNFIYTIFSRYFFLAQSVFTSVLLIIAGVLVPTVIFSIGYYYITNRYLIKITRRAIILFILTILLTLIFAWLTIHLNSGFGSGKTFIDSVKMGYPVFWINIFLGISSILICKLKNA